MHVYQKCTDGEIKTNEIPTIRLIRMTKKCAKCMFACDCQVAKDWRKYWLSPRNDILKPVNTPIDAHNNNKIHTVNYLTDPWWSVDEARQEYMGYPLCIMEWCDKRNEITRQSQQPLSL